MEQVPLLWGVGSGYKVLRSPRWGDIQKASSILMLFYYSAPLQNDNDTIVMSQCMQFILGDKRDIHQLWLKKKGGERGKQTSALGWNKNERMNTLHLPFVYGQNELRFACPYFILGPMLLIPSRFLHFQSQVGHYRPTGKPPPNDITIVPFCRGAE